MKEKKIAFVVDRISFHELFYIPLLSALAERHGHAVRLVEFGPNPQKALGELRVFAPDIIGYSICSNEMRGLQTEGIYLKLVKNKTISKMLIAIAPKISYN